MANFLKVGDGFKIKIPNWREEDKTTFYEIKIEIGNVTWTVSRRYSEFAKLHSFLVSDHGVQADILPPKKVLGNRDESFIERRRLLLEEYLNTVFKFLQKTMPKKLAVFLKFQQFDVTFIVKNLAVNFFQCGEMILSKLRKHTFTPLELYAIDERLKQPCSNVDLVDQREDFSHVLDFCYQLPELVIKGSDVAVEGSNIILNNLPLNLNVFKSLEILTLTGVNCEMFSDLGSLRLTLQRLHLNNCRVTNLVDILLCDQVHKTDFGHQNDWNLTQMSITHSNLTKFDEAVCLIPKMKNFILDDNRITDLSYIEHLPILTSLSVKNNCLCLTNPLETSKLVTLDLSQNQLNSLRPFGSLRGLETLNVQINRITDINEVWHISGLPFLENLSLTGNPVSQIVDYRIKVLEFFGSRAYRICLDNECADQTELDKVAIMSALHKQCPASPL